MRAREFSESEGVDIAINHGAGEDLEDASSAWEHAAGSHDARRSLTREEKGRERKREEDRGYEGLSKWTETSFLRILSTASKVQAACQYSKTG